MAFWRTYYHLIWATASRKPLITPACEAKLYGYIQGKVDAMGGILHAIGGVEDHIHLIVSIPPKISIAEFVQTIKRSSAYRLNQVPSASSVVFAWQHGYGVLTLGGKQLEEAKAYVNNQKAHHANRSEIAGLERF